MSNLLFLLLLLFILMFPLNKKSIFSLVEKMRKYLKLNFLEVLKKFFFLLHQILPLADEN